MADMMKEVRLEDVKKSEIDFIEMDGKSKIPGSLAEGEKSNDFYRIHFHVKNRDLQAAGIDMANNPRGIDGFTRVSIRVWVWQVVPAKSENCRTVRLLNGDRTYNLGVPQYDEAKKPILNEKGRMIYKQVSLPASVIASMFASASVDVPAAPAATLVAEPVEMAPVVET